MRDGQSNRASRIPIAVMADHATTELLRELPHRHVSRVILKPLRAHLLLDAFAEFEAQRRK